MKKFFQSNFGIYTAFAIAILVLYFPTSNGGFASDFIGWKQRFDSGDWSDIINCFGYKGLHQFFHVFYFSLYKIFGINGFGWYFIFALAHSFNGFLVFIFLKKLLNHFCFSNVFWPSFLAASLFLINPYQVEVLAWKPCFHYLLSAGLIIGSLHYLLIYFQTTKHLWVSLLLFTLSLFVLEISVITPLLVVVLLLIVKRSQSLNFIKPILPFFIILIGFFCLNRLVLGAWVGHYGAEKHLNTDFLLIFGNEFRYLTKYLFFSRYFPNGTKIQIFQTFNNPYIVWGMVSFLSALAGLYLYFINKISKRILLAGACLAMFLIAILPVSNLYHAYELTSENDRYGYLASIFFSTMSVVLFFPFNKKTGTNWLAKIGKYIGLFVLGSYLLLSAIFVRQNIQNWHSANSVYHSLLKEYKWEQEPNVYILAAPDTYEGIFLFKDFSGQGTMIKEALETLDNRYISGKILQVAQFTMRKSDDKVAVKVEDGKIVVKFQQWGNWWMKNGYGVNNHETVDYSFKLISNGYQLKLKDSFPKNAVFIYSTKGKWKSLKL